jgi:hypothetical protein
MDRAPDCDDLCELRLGDPSSSVVRGTSLHICKRQHVSLTVELDHPVLLTATDDAHATAAPPWTLVERVLDDALGASTEQYALG